jgi:hypothetical protein
MSECANCSAPYLSKSSWISECFLSLDVASRGFAWSEKDNRFVRKKMRA